MSASWVYTAMVIYVILGTIVAYTSGRGMGKGVTEYFLANRTIGGVVAALTYSATTYSAFMMVGLAGFTYAGGVGALGFEFVYLSGLVLAAFFGPRFWIAGKEFGYVSPAELLGDRYQSRWVAAIATLASCIFLIPYSAVQLMGVGYLMSGLTKGAIPFMVGVVIATLLAIAWAWIAGMRSVAWTDSLQALIMIVASLLVVLFIVFDAFGGFGNMFAAIEQKYPKWLTVPGPGFFKLHTFIGLTIPWFFFCISNPQVSQRLFIPRSMRAMRTMLVGFLIFGFIYTLVSIIWGFSARILIPDLKVADMASPSLLGSQYVPPILALVVMIGIVAAAISTIDSILLTLSSMVARDLYRNLSKGSSEELELWLGKLVVPVISVVALLFASKKLGLIAVLSVASSAGLLVMVPAIFGAFFWKRGTAAGAIISIVVGGIVAFYLQFSNLKPLGHWPGVWSLIVSLTLFVVISLFTPAPSAKADNFLSTVNRALRQKNAL